MNKGYIAIIITVVASIALITSTFVLGNAIKSINKDTTIEVTGSAQKAIKADYSEWTGSFSVTAPVQKDAYATLVSHKKIVVDYLKSLGVPEDRIGLSSVMTNTLYQKNGYEVTNIIEGYTLTQTVTVKSDDVNLVDTVAQKATDLIAQGVNFSSNPAAFYCKDLSAIKVEMIGAGTKDCTERAKQIVTNAGGKLGSIVSSRTGVFQITPANSTEISDYGISDTSSINKQITAVVKCTFKVN